MHFRYSVSTACGLTYTAIPDVFVCISSGRYICPCMTLRHIFLSACSAPIFVVCIIRPYDATVGFHMRVFVVFRCTARSLTCVPMPVLTFRPRSCPLMTERFACLCSSCVTVRLVNLSSTCSRAGCTSCTITRISRSPRWRVSKRMLMTVCIRSTPRNLIL